MAFNGRKLLCGSFEDIVYALTNTSKVERPDMVRESLSNEAKDKLRYMLRFEFDLYNHFLVKLHRQLKEIDVKAELKTRELTQKKLQEKCQAILAKCNRKDCICNLAGDANVKYIMCCSIVEGTEYYELNMRLNTCLKKPREEVGGHPQQLLEKINWKPDLWLLLLLEAIKSNFMIIIAVNVFFCHYMRICNVKASRANIA